MHKRRAWYVVCQTAFNAGLLHTSVTLEVIRGCHQLLSSQLGTQEVNLALAVSDIPYTNCYFPGKAKLSMHLLTGLNTNLFVNNGRKKKSRFALRNRPRQGQKGCSEAGNKEWREPLFSVTVRCQGEEGMAQNSPPPLLESRVFHLLHWI